MLTDAGSEVLYHTQRADAPPKGRASRATPLAYSAACAAHDHDDTDEDDRRDNGHAGVEET